MYCLFFDDVLMSLKIHGTKTQTDTLKYTCAQTHMIGKKKGTEEGREEAEERVRRREGGGRKGREGKKETKTDGGRGGSGKTEEGRR